MTHAQESGHWYRGDGAPVWEVPSADGKRMIAPDVRHARKFNLVPGVTSIIRCAAAPGLERWKIDQHILAALTLPRKPGETELSWLARVKQDAEAQARNARERGTLIHAAIQGHYQGEPPDESLFDHVKVVSRVIDEKCGTALPWIAEQSFSHPAGFGGKVDLHCPGWIVDVKGTEAISAGMKTWDEHALQLAAYRKGLNLPEARCGIVYVERLLPVALFVEVPEVDLVRGWGMFVGLLDYWKSKNRMAA